MQPVDGIHHITAITTDAQRAVDFYAGALGLRLGKRAVNPDDRSAYHLIFTDDDDRPGGTDLTLFEYRRARYGRAGDGMIHRIMWRVGSELSLDHWRRRLATYGHDSELTPLQTLRFSDPDGLTHELVVDNSEDEPLRASAPGLPAEHALRGFAGVRAYSSSPDASVPLFGKTLGFRRLDPRTWDARGATRGARIVFDAPPHDAGVSGAGVVHHIAFAVVDDHHERWHGRIADSGRTVTEIVDRQYWKSFYFADDSGLRCELATRSPGYSADEPDGGGHRLSLPPELESRRSELESSFPPLIDPWAAFAA